MITLPRQLTQDFITLERELIRMRREFAHFRRGADEMHPAVSHTATIASMQLPVGRWEDMEQEIYGRQE